MASPAAAAAVYAAPLACGFALLAAEGGRAGAAADRSGARALYGLGGILCVAMAAIHCIAVAASVYRGSAPPGSGLLTFEALRGQRIALCVRPGFVALGRERSTCDARLVLDPDGSVAARGCARSGRDGIGRGRTTCDAAPAMDADGTVADGARRIAALPFRPVRWTLLPPASSAGLWVGGGALLCLSRGPDAAAPYCLTVGRLDGGLRDSRQDMGTVVEYGGRP